MEKYYSYDSAFLASVGSKNSKIFDHLPVRVKKMWKLSSECMPHEGHHHEHDDSTHPELYHGILTIISGHSKTIVL